MILSAPRYLTLATILIQSRSWISGVYPHPAAFSIRFLDFDWSIYQISFSYIINLTLTSFLSFSIWDRMNIKLSIPKLSDFVVWLN